MTLEKFVTFGKLISLGKKGFPLGKKGHICKSGSLLEKWVTFGKKGDALARMGHT